MIRRDAEKQPPGARRNAEIDRALAKLSHTARIYCFKPGWEFMGDVLASKGERGRSHIAKQDKAEVRRWLKTFWSEKKRVAARRREGR